MKHVRGLRGANGADSIRRTIVAKYEKVSNVVPCRFNGIIIGDTTEDCCKHAIFLLYA